MGIGLNYKIETFPPFLLRGVWLRRWHQTWLHLFKGKTESKSGFCPSLPMHGLLEDIVMFPLFLTGFLPPLFISSSLPPLPPLSFFILSLSLSSTCFSYHSIHISCLSCSFSLPCCLLSTCFCRYLASFFLLNLCCSFFLYRSSILFVFLLLWSLSFCETCMWELVLLPLDCSVLGSLRGACCSNFPKAAYMQSPFPQGMVAPIPFRFLTDFRKHLSD